MTINSYGIILYREVPDSLPIKKEYLLICRKDSVSYVVFLRGQYTRNMIPILGERMTQQERENIKTQSFDVLWDKLWQHHPSRKHHHRQKFKKQKERAKQRFEKREWELIFDTISANWTEPEWGFPKGRKKKSETALKAALREFTEETGFNESDIDVQKNYPPMVERYTATDSKEYQIVYFLAKIKNPTKDPPKVDSSYRSSEISNIGWFTKDDALKKIREYHKEKRSIVKKINL